MQWLDDRTVIIEGRTFDIFTSAKLMGL